MKKLLPILFVLPTILFSACEPEKAIVAKKPFPIEDVYLQKPSGELKFQTSTMFLWNENFTDQEVRTVLDISAAKDALIESRLRKLKSKTTLDERIQEFHPDVQNIAARRLFLLENDQDGIPTLKKSIHEMEPTRITLQQKKPGFPSGWDSSKTDRTQCRDRLFRESPYCVWFLEFSSLNRKYESLLKKLEASEEEMQEIDKKLSDYPEEKKVIFEQCHLATTSVQLGQEISETIQSIRGKVRSLSKAEEITLSFDSNGKPSLVIRGWIDRDTSLLNSAPRLDFSTEDGSIRNLKFTPEGGRIQFEVSTENDEKYFFDLYRTQIDDPFRRTIFQGDLKRQKNGNTPEQGVVKWIVEKE